jgi:hypothetical protein
VFTMKYKLEIFSLPGCYAAWYSSYRNLGQPLGPIFKGCPETSVNNYESILHNIPEDRRSHLHSGESLKSRR